MQFSVNEVKKWVNKPAGTVKKQNCKCARQLSTLCVWSTCANKSYCKEASKHNVGAGLVSSVHVSLSLTC